MADTTTSKANRTSIRSVTTDVSTIGTRGLLLLLSTAMLIVSSIGMYMKANTYAYASDTAWQCNITAATLGVFACLAFSAFLVWSIQKQNRKSRMNF